jgi:SHS2 domain-containing protein
MCEIDKVEIDPHLEPYVFEVSNVEDMESLLYEFLEEFIFIFTTELLVFKEVKIIEFDRQNWKLKARCCGEKYQRKKHGEGTEVKAITYSNMQIYETENKAEIYVIVDI